MKKIISLVAVCLVAVPAFAAPNNTGRRTMAAQMVAAPRQTASVNQLNAAANYINGAPTAKKSTVRIEPDEPDFGKDKDEDKEPETPAIDYREKEKAACINNNIGVGNTFVWASRYSNTGNYASMVEDMEHPENNTCFVKVDVKSDDARISVSDIPSKYFEWGQNITCASWADEAKLKQRILDAKKSARTWGTVAGAVGGAGLGVGIMELFGNRLIGGKVQGQKALKDDALIRSQLLALKKESVSEYNAFISAVKALKRECEDEIWNDADEKDLPEGCKNFNYDALLTVEQSTK